MRENDQKVSLSGITGILKNTLRVTQMVWEEKKRSVILMFFTITFLSILPFLYSATYGLLINELSRSFGTHFFATSGYLYLIGFIVIAITSPFFYKLYSHFEKILYLYFEKKFDLSIIEGRVRLDVASQEDPLNNDLINKIQEGGAWKIVNFTGRQLYLYQNILEIVIAASILSYLNWWLLLILLLGTIPELIIEGIYGNDVWNIHGSNAESRRNYGNLRGHFERLSNLTELRLFQNTKFFFNKIALLLRDFENKQRAIERKTIWYKLGGTILSQSSIAITLLWFIFEVVNGNIEIGTLTFIIASVNRFQGSLSSLFSSLGRQYGDSLFVTDFFRFLSLPQVITTPEKGIVLPKDRTPEIRFENVSFKYPNTDKLVLRNVNLTIPAGTKMALVGVNGAGKTTFVKLLCRFYDPTEGRITLDGHDLRDIDLESWYYNLGILFQDYALYHFLVKESIAIGRTANPLDIGKVRAAATSGEADQFISEWQEQYDQRLGKEFTGGVEPSIGQWQKLAIARTFYRDPRVIILDEPTSSIDAEAEAKIFERMEHLSKDKTVILISHRFSTVRQADQICVFENGTVSELGTHATLLKAGKSYARLFKLQAKGYE
jgi:ATP-binding cassette subfamily B protein